MIKDQILTYQQLITLEKNAKNNGSGIELESLSGVWKFTAVWKKNQTSVDSFSSNLLRILSACLELKKSSKAIDDKNFSITNSISFASILIEFKGQAELEGTQPLLIFFFDQLTIKLARTTLWKSKIDIPLKKDRPFFSLISIDYKQNQLIARGRGGGIAIWIK